MALELIFGFDETDAHAPQGRFLTGKFIPHEASLTALEVVQKLGKGVMPAVGLGQ